MTANDSFDLYHHLKNNYEQIVLKKEEGLILFHWYQEAPDKALSENDIYDVIKKIKKDLGTPIAAEDRERTPYLQNLEILKRLKIHFLKSNKVEGKQWYQLTAFARDFCKIIEHKLNIEFQPSDVQRSIKDLYQLLCQKIQEPDEFKHWYESQFETKKRPLVGQLEKLGREIEHTTFELNLIIKDKTLDFEQKIEQCNDKLTLILQQGEQLKEAFSELDLIETYLNDFNVPTDAEEALNIIQNVLNFIRFCHDDLSDLLKKILKVKDVVYKFTNDIHKKVYDAQLEQFLDAVLARTQSSIKRGTHKDTLEVEIRLPNVLQTANSLLIGGDKFTRIEHKTFDKTPYTLLQTPETTSEASQSARKKQERESQTKTRIKMDVNRWFDLIRKDLIEQKNIDFTPYFYRILESSEGKMETAVKVAGMVIKKFSKKKLIQIEIRDEPAFMPDSSTITNSSIQIWQMNLIYNSEA
jgi:hypothetical protein